MPGLFRSLEMMAARGAEGLAPEPRKSLCHALTGLRHPGGGCAAPSGEPDPYYTFFAWLCLRALCVPPAETQPLERYLLACAHASPIDAACSRLVRLSLAPRKPTFGTWLALLLNPPRDTYTAFLSMLALDASCVSGVPPALQRFIRKRIRLTGGGATTPRLAARLALTPHGHAEAGTLGTRLRERRCPTGGFRASANVPAPDLLATAVARFALAAQRPPGFTAEETAADLAFTEACWTEDGLFAPTPCPARGDTEYAFYALLSLGTCRAAP